MAILLSVLVPMLLNKSEALIEAEVGKILGFNVKREMEKLRDTMGIIHGVLQDAEAKQVKNDGVRLWLSGLKDAAYDADDVLDVLMLDVMRREEEEGRKVAIEDRCGYFLQYLSSIVANFFSSHNPLLFRDKMSSKIEGVVERIDFLAAQRSKLGLTVDTAGGSSSRLDRRPVEDASEIIQTHAGVHESGLLGREADVARITTMLLSDEIGKQHVSVLPVVGMGGLGKTTLAKMVINDPGVKGHFELLLWVSVSQDFSPERIAKTMIEMATNTGFSLSDMNSLQTNLRKLIGAKRYLLVLDDVWSRDPAKWDEVRDLLTFGARGSAVVATTRFGDIANLMGTLEPYWLAKLPEETCWLIFKNRAFPGVDGERRRPALEPIGKAIVGKCGGLPLAAKALGGMMRNIVDEAEWRAVRDSEIWDLPVGGQLEILPALRLSYNQLRPHLKQCFAFCAVFPKNQEMEKEMLVHLWIANGFVPSNTTKHLELIGNGIFKELEQGSFFQDVKIREDGRRITTCKMHDLMHDLARTIMGNECCYSPLHKWNLISDKKFRHLLINQEEIPDDDDAAASTSTQKGCGKLHTHKTVRTLVLQNSVDSSTIIWSNTKYLRALSLQNTKSMSTFPISICHLIHLRYLDLSGSRVTTLPEELSMLLVLQALDLSDCDLLVELPKSLRLMRSLTHLYLQGCKSLTRMPAGMGQLRSLQKLTRYVVAGKECEADSGGVQELKELDLHGGLELCNVKNVTRAADAEAARLGSKENLQILDLDWGEGGEECEAAGAVLQALSPHHNLKELAIRRYAGIEFPTWLMGDPVVLPNLVEICFTGCSRCEQLPQLWRLPSLEVLEIGDAGSLKNMGGTEFYGAADADAAAAAAFPCLRKLKLYELGELKAWEAAERGRSSFPRIAEIAISGCPELTTIPSFPSVRDLKINNCPSFCPDKGFFGSMAYLERLEMDSCDELVLMLEQEDRPGRSLQHLRIKNCEQLMFSARSSYGMWKQFSSLMNLEIVGCGGLVILPDEILSCMISLKRLQIHCCYQLLGTSYSEEGVGFQGLAAVEELDIQVNTEFPCFQPEGLLHLPALKLLRIYSNHGLTALPADFSPSLRELVIYNCWNLSSLPEGLGRLPALEYIYLLELELVSSFPEEQGGYKALKTLSLENCPNIVSLPVAMQQRLPGLGYLKVEGCEELERRCTNGGDYWPLVSRIPVRHIRNASTGDLSSS